MGEAYWVIITVSLEGEQVPFEIVQINELAPTDKPLTPLVGLEELAKVPVPV